MGCGYGQGFLVARPMAAPGVEALIRTATGTPRASSARDRRGGRPGGRQRHGEAGRPRRVAKISGHGVSDSETATVII